jgi:hypothetical protein
MVAKNGSEIFLVEARDLASLEAVDDCVEFSAKNKVTQSI